MTADFVAILTILLPTFILVLLIGWIFGSMNLYQKISDVVVNEAFPRRWLLLCLFPGFGHWFLKGYQDNWQPFKLLHKDYATKVTRDVSDASWLIIQEHIDDHLAIRKGSTLTALKSDMPVYYFQEVDTLPGEESPIIRVTTPRRSYDELEWARMFYNLQKDGLGESGWIVQNRKSHVPILIRLGKVFHSISPENSSGILKSNTKLYMGTTTYTLIELPGVGIRPKGQDGFGQIIAGISFIGASENCNVVLHSAQYPLVAIFDNGSLTVFGDPSLDIESFTEIDGFAENTDKNGRVANTSISSTTYKLFVGDRFQIEDAEFIVDYV